jgi:hypothetical protein
MKLDIKGTGHDYELPSYHSTTEMMINSDKFKNQFDFVHSKNQFITYTRIVCLVLAGVCLVAAVISGCMYCKKKGDNNLNDDGVLA